ncbi:DSC E3 ubiquitin ligase complex subunit 3 [Pleurostoma richardsiae]|uniref:DSC E3 ubiquitin ligase complex subunit 3 n=1 Tax=Pleurostoma richardsiae TaxID=41990 RepID=A0AA38RFE5_9PEZI|nr:DSC E3 ubiquitin ligase complex subunit 3 [Pleurostoma richardsiae]
MSSSSSSAAGAASRRTSPTRTPLLPPPSSQVPGARTPQSAATTYQPPLLLTVRFSTSIPDLLLDIPRPGQTTVAALKHLIRGRLAEPNSRRRLRFIHGGKILPDGAVLGSVLKPPPPPPAARRDGHHHHHHAGGEDGSDSPRGKGKAVEGRGEPAQRVYVNCSIGDNLTDAELAEEARAALTPAPDAAADGPGGGKSPGLPPGSGGVRSTGAQLGGAAAASSEARQRQGDAAGAGRTPRGFDRLLTAGFTTAEVNQLRLQFRSIQAARHTPDTMPSPDTLRSMEDAWIDNNNDAGMAGAGGGGGLAGGDMDAAAAAGDTDEFGMHGLLDVLIRGMMIGFVWPLGSIGWLVRGEARLSKRMRIFVGFGFMLSITIGIIRAISGPER